MAVIVLFLLTLGVDLAVSIQEATITAIVPKGLKFEIQDEGFSLVALHFSINKPVINTQGGDVNVDIRTPTNGVFVYMNTMITVNPGDVVNYWVYGVRNGRGEQKLNLSHTIPGVTCTKTSPCLVLEDNFDFLNHEVWEHEVTAGGGGNWEFQYYINNRSNSYVKNGVLYIKPTLTSDRFGEQFLKSGTLDLWGSCTNNAWYGCSRTGSSNNIINPIQSARLRSSRGFNFKYGKVEVRATMPAGDWIWPAIWMLPTRNAYGQWPASGEIDIVESRGNRNYQNSGGTHKGVDSFGSTLHYGPSYAYNRWYTAHVSKTINRGTLADDFHTYGMEWTADHIKFFFDGVETLDVSPPSNGGFWKYGNLDQTGVENPWRADSKMAPFDQKFHLIMNVAVGGVTGFFTDADINSPYPKPWSDSSSRASLDFWNAKNRWYPTWNPYKRSGEDAAMKVDYVKVWQLDGTV